MEVKAQFRNRIGIFAACGAIGVIGAAVLYYGIYFVLALVNYFDGFYKHNTFYILYPTAISYLITFFSKGTLKHLPGHETELNWGLPLLLVCGMVGLGIVLVFLLRNNALKISDGGICGKGILRKGFDLPRSMVQSVRPHPFDGLILEVQDKRHLFLFLKNRDQIMEALEEAESTV